MNRSPASTMSRKLGRAGIERRLGIGEALQLGDELVTMEDPNRMELLERESAFLAIGQRRLLGACGRIRSRRCSSVRGWTAGERASCACN
jgi:hypothetical protein